MTLVHRILQTARAVAHVVTSWFLKLVVYPLHALSNWKSKDRRIPDEAEVTEVAESLMKMLEEHFDKLPIASPAPAADVHALPDPVQESVTVTQEQPSKPCLPK